MDKREINVEEARLRYGLRCVRVGASWEGERERDKFE